MCESYSCRTLPTRVYVTNGHRVYATCDDCFTGHHTLIDKDEFSCCDVCKEDTDYIDMHPKTCIDCKARMCHAHGDDLMGDGMYYRCDRCTADVLTVEPFENFEKTVAYIKDDISVGQVIVKSFRLSPTMITTFEFKADGPSCQHIKSCKCDAKKKVTMRSQ